VLVPDLRPLSVGEIIDVAIKIWRRHFKTLARIVFVVVAPVELFSTLITASVGNFDPETFDPVTGDPTFNGGAFAGWLAGMFTAQVLSGLAFLIASAAVLRAVSVAYLGGTPDWRDSLRAATSQIGRLIWLAFLMFGGLMLAAVALILPAVWLGVAWSLAFPVLIAEGQRGTKALGRSFKLIQNRWWPTFGVLFLAFLMQSLIGIVLGIPLGILTVLTSGDSLVAIFFSMIVNVVASVITTPFMAAVLVLIYFDLRVRKEGFDLQLLSQGVGIPGGAYPANAPWLTGGGGGQWAGGQWGGAGGQWGNPGGGWGGQGGNWPSQTGNWPPPTGEPVGPGYGSTGAGGYPAPGSGSAPPGGGWPAGSSGWAPPGSGLSPDETPTGPPPPTPQFADPIDPTGPPPTPQFADPIDPTGPPQSPPSADPGEPTGPPPPSWSRDPVDPERAGEETPPAGEQPEQ
jgi:hypothetical protein